MRAKLHQLCLTLSDPRNYSPLGSSFHVQAGILEWVAMPSSRGSSRPRDQIRVSYVSSLGRWVLYHGVTWVGTEFSSFVGFKGYSVREMKANYYCMYQC